MDRRLRRSGVRQIRRRPVRLRGWGFLDFGRWRSLLPHPEDFLIPTARHPQEQHLQEQHLQEHRRLRSEAVPPNLQGAEVKSADTTAFAAASLDITR